MTLMSCCRPYPTVAPVTVRPPDPPPEIIMIDKLADAVCCVVVSFTVTLKVVVPAADGVPVMNPLILIPSPAGRPAAEKE